MKPILTALVLSSVLALGATGAEARGCLKGAIAGHFAHHGMAGAAAGCAVGHHMAHRHDVRSETYTR